MRIRGFLGTKRRQRRSREAIDADREARARRAETAELRHSISEGDAPPDALDGGSGALGYSAGDYDDVLPDDALDPVAPPARPVSQHAPRSGHVDAATGVTWDVFRGDGYPREGRNQFDQRVIQRAPGGPIEFIPGRFVKDSPDRSRDPFRGMARIARGAGEDPEI